MPRPKDVWLHRGNRFYQGRTARTRLAHDTNGTRLRPLFARLFNKGHRGSDVQTWESAVQHATLVEIYLLSAICCEEPVSLLRQKRCDSTSRSTFVRLHSSSLSSRIVLQSPSGHTKYLFDRGPEIFSRCGQFQALPHCNFPHCPRLTSRIRLPIR